MLNEDLDRALDHVDLDTDRPSWSRFCEWLDAFHEIDITKLARFNSFSDFEQSSGARLSLKYLESIKDLWVKWSKVAEMDMFSGV